MRSLSIRPVCVVLALLLVLAACSSGGPAAIEPPFEAEPSTDPTPTLQTPAEATPAEATAAGPTTDPTAERLTPTATPETPPTSTEVTNGGEPDPFTIAPVHPWYECEFFDYALIGVNYRVTGIAADDPDGGLVAHESPGVDTTVTEILPQSTAELQVFDCQQNVDSGNLWWLIQDRGWVNASYLEAYVPFGADDWEPGMTRLIDPENLPDIVGLEGEDLPALTEAIRAAVVFEDFTKVEVSNFTGIDARGGIAQLDINGLGDDSIGGYRMQLTIDFIKDEDATNIIGLRVVSATGRAICTRGVSADSALCV